MAEKIYDKNFRDFILDKVDAWVVDAVGFVDAMGKYPRLRVLMDQLLRSATSVGANVHEAQGASRKQYAYFLEIAMRSGHETSYWLFLVGKMEKKLSIRAHHLRNECIEIEKVLQTSISSLRSVSHSSDHNS